MTPEGVGECFVPTGLLAGAAALAKFPPVSIGTAMFAGPETWQYAIERATPPERWEVLQQLEGPLLAAMPNGRPLVHATPCDCGKDGDPAPYVYGDSWLLPLLRQALALMPANVASVAAREAAWLAVGRESRAWTSCARFIGSDGVLKLRVVVCGPNTTLRTVLHEAVHVYAATTREESQAVSGDAEAAIAATAEAEGWAVQPEDHHAMHECLADALSLIWLYRAPAGTPS